MTQTDHAVFPFEIRDISPPDNRLDRPFTQIEGRAVPYDTWANVGGYMERFTRGAFTKSTSESAKALPLMLFHGRDDMWPIGLATGWSSRSDGLHGIWNLDTTPNAQRAAELAQSGSLGFLSIGFVPVRSVPEMVKDWNPALGEDHMDRMTHTEARLVEVSIVPTPAYADAQVLSVRAGRPRGSQPLRRDAYREDWSRMRATLGI